MASAETEQLHVPMNVHVLNFRELCENLGLKGSADIRMFFQFQSQSLEFLESQIVI